MQLGYQKYRFSTADLTAWRNEGRPTVSGVNVPSKAFGEKVHHERNIPDVTPEELKALRRERRRSADPGRAHSGGVRQILHSRRNERSRRRSHFVGGRVEAKARCDGGDQLRRADAQHHRHGGVAPLGADECAGAQKRHHGLGAGGLGVGNQAGDAARRLRRQEAVNERRRWQHKSPRKKKLRWISAPQLADALASMNDGVTYLIDVRSEAEFEAGHISGSINVPGGQAVQRADDFVAVRNAQIIFISNESARAVMAAYWYRQMGFPHVSVLQGGLRAWSENGHLLARGVLSDEPLGFAAAQQSAMFVDAQTLAEQIKSSSALILDVGTSLEFESAHVLGAKWISRGWIELKLPEQYSDRGQAIVVSCADGRQSVFAARALGGLGYKDVRVLAGGVQAWRAAGLKTETGRDRCLVQPNDVVLSPSIRGSKEDMQRYLDWELKLER